jgi:hypothetical protein
MVREALSLSTKNIALFVNTSGMISIIECTELPPMVNSQGLWSYICSGTVPFLLPLLQLQLILIFTITKASQYFLKCYGVPKFTTQLLVRAISSTSSLYFSYCQYLTKLLSWRFYFIVTEQFFLILYAPDQHNPWSIFPGTPQNIQKCFLLD